MDEYQTSQTNPEPSETYKPLAIFIPFEITNLGDFEIHVRVTKHISKEIREGVIKALNMP